MSPHECWLVRVTVTTVALIRGVLQEVILQSLGWLGYCDYCQSNKSKRVFIIGKTIIKTSIILHIYTTYQYCDVSARSGPSSG